MLAYGTNAVILGMFVCLSLSLSSLSLIMIYWLIDVLSEKLWHLHFVFCFVL